jgi:hypothetical protein
MSSAGAAIGDLNQALKQLSDTTTPVVEGILSHTASRSVVVLVSNTIDVHGINAQAGSKLQQMKLHSVTHAVLAQVARHVFGTFRADNLLIDTSSSPFDDPADEQTLLLQLMLERKKAFNWLQLVNADSSGAAGQYFERQVVDVYANKLVGGLLHCDPSLIWSAEVRENESSIINQLLPAAKHVAAAAIKAQVICSCMHTRLIQLHVPGWNQPSPSNSGLGDVPAPDGWSEWPGVVPYSSACMCMGAALPVAAGVLPSGTTAAAAVYSIEPAVIQVAERMEELVTAAAAGAEQPQPQPFQVIRKAKMCVANNVK